VLPDPQDVPPSGTGRTRPFLDRFQCRWHGEALMVIEDGRTEGDQGFEIDEAEVVFRGLCPACRGVPSG
jgi:hypothetical protein